MSHLTLCLQPLIHTRTDMDNINQSPGEMDWKCIRLLGLITAERFAGDVPQSYAMIFLNMHTYTHGSDMIESAWIGFRFQ